MSTPEARKKNGTSRADVDMTQGSIYRHILMFALPLLVGNFFQQLYNTVDTWVLGNYVSKEAFAAVGTIAPVFNLVVNTFIGLSNGAGVVISQYYGAGNIKQVKRSVHTSIVMAAIASVLFTVFGLAMKDTLIGFMKPSADMLPHAREYIGIIFTFLTFQIFYNVASSILRAVGDSKRPFYFLIVACITNIVLDLFFVLKLNMGVKGVAYATVIAQGLSAVLAMYTLFTVDSCVRLSLKELCFDIPIIKKVLKIGIPGAIQVALVNFSNLFVTSYINYFGTDFSSGYSAYFKSELIIFMPQQSISLATTTFVGQNFGAGNIERAKQGVRASMVLCLIPTLIIGALMMAFAPQITAFFNSDPAVMAYGAMCIRFITPFYLIHIVIMIHTAALRGAGDTLVPMIIMVGCFVFLRQIYLFVMTNYIVNTPVAVLASYPVGWVIGTVLNAVRYSRMDFSAKFAKLRD